MSAMYKILGVNSKVYGGKTLQYISTMCSQRSQASRGFSTLPNIICKKYKQFYISKERSRPAIGSMHVSVSALGLLQQIRNSASTTQEEQQQQHQQEASGDGSKKGKKGGNSWKYGLIFLGVSLGMGSGFFVAQMGPPSIDENGNEIVDEFSNDWWLWAYIQRAKKEGFMMKKMIEEPSSRKLLPDPVKEPYYQPPYTLVLELTGVLVHPEWTMKTGWRFKKRPAVEYFLQQIAPPLFEVVIFTKENGFTAFPVIDSLDQHGCVMFRLFRDATLYKKGAHIKDLDCLNRDPSKIILVDCDPDAVSLQPRNALLLPKWKGADDDKTLVDLAMFLRTVAAMGVEDVRSVLEHYSDCDNPLEKFKENQAMYLEAQAQAQEQEKSKNKSLTSGYGFGLNRRR